MVDCDIGLVVGHRPSKSGTGVRFSYVAPIKTGERNGKKDKDSECI